MNNEMVRLMRTIKLNPNQAIQDVQITGLEGFTDMLKYENPNTDGPPEIWVSAIINPFVDNVEFARFYNTLDEQEIEMLDLMPMGMVVINGAAQHWFVGETPTNVDQDN